MTRQQIQRLIRTGPSRRSQGAREHRSRKAGSIHPRRSRDKPASSKRRSNRDRVQLRLRWRSTKADAGRVRPLRFREVTGEARAQERAQTLRNQQLPIKCPAGHRPHTRAGRRAQSPRSEERQNQCRPGHRPIPYTQPVRSPLPAPTLPSGFSRHARHGLWPLHRPRLARSAG